MLARTEPLVTRCTAFLLLSLMSGCLVGPDRSTAPDRDDATGGEPATAAIDELLGSARQSSGVIAASLSLQAVEAMLQAGAWQRALSEAERLAPADSLPPALQLRYLMARARIEVGAQRPGAALDWLNQARDIDTGSGPGQDYYLLLGRLYLDDGRYTDAVHALMQLTGAERVAPDPAAPAESGLVLAPVDLLWQALDRMSEGELTLLGAAPDSYQLRGWVELARMYRAEQSTMKSQLDAIARWRRIWARHPAAARLPLALAQLQEAWEQRPLRIALILPLGEPAGQAIQEGFFGAYYQQLPLAGQPGEAARITVYDSTGAAVIDPLYEQAVADGAGLIIGPLRKPLVNQLHALARLPVPTLALNYADDDDRTPDNLFQFGLAPEDEISQAVHLAWQAGHRSAALLAPDTAGYVRLRNLFQEAWSGLGGELVSRATFSSGTGSAGDYADTVKRLVGIEASEARAERLLDLLPRNAIEFTPRRRQDIDCIFLVANPRQGRQLNPALAFYFAGDVPVYAMPSINDGLANQSENRDLDGIVFIDAPWILDAADPLKRAISTSLRQVQGPLQRLRAMGVDAFRLYPRLEQMTSSLQPMLRGATGELRMSSNGRVRRNLEVARFVDGFAAAQESALPVSAE